MHPGSWDLVVPLGSRVPREQQVRWVPRVCLASLEASDPLERMVPWATKVLQVLWGCVATLARRDPMVFVALQVLLALPVLSVCADSLGQRVSLVSLELWVCVVTMALKGARVTLVPLEPEAGLVLMASMGRTEKMEPRARLVLVATTVCRASAESLDLLGPRVSRESEERRAVTESVGSRVCRVPRETLAPLVCEVPEEVATLDHKVLRVSKVPAEIRDPLVPGLVDLLAQWVRRERLEPLASLDPRETLGHQVHRVSQVNLEPKATRERLERWVARVFVDPRETRETKVRVETREAQVLGALVERSGIVACKEAPVTVALRASLDPLVSQGLWVLRVPGVIQARTVQRECKGQVDPRVNLATAVSLARLA